MKLCNFFKYGGKRICLRKGCYICHPPDFFWVGHPQKGRLPHVKAVPYLLKSLKLNNCKTLHRKFKEIQITWKSVGVNHFHSVET